MLQELMKLLLLGKGKLYQKKKKSFIVSCRYFVFGRVAEAIKYTAEEYHCKGLLAEKIKKILVVSDSEKTLRFKDGVLIVLVNLSLGSFGTIDGEKMKGEILRGI